jgi:hypothetical protein
MIISLWNARPRNQRAHFVPDKVSHAIQNMILFLIIITYNKVTANNHIVQYNNPTPARFQLLQDGLRCFR